MAAPKRSAPLEVLPEGAQRPWHLRFDHEPLAAPVHHLLRAEQLERAGQAELALAEVSAALAAEPEPPEAVLALGRLLLELKRAEELASFLEPRVAPWLMTRGPLGPGQTELLGLAASAQVLLADYPRAAELYRRAVEAEPGSSRLLNALAATEQAQGRAAEAAELYRRSLEAEPDQPRIRALLERLQPSNGGPRR
jgi:tetratricopeptide (TPR) repeat protein